MVLNVIDIVDPCAACGWEIEEDRKGYSEYCAHCADLHDMVPRL